jgi:hypothetical protein
VPGTILVLEAERQAFSLFGLTLRRPSGYGGQMLLLVN